MIEQIENLSSYFIQPYIDGQYCLTRIFKESGKIKLKSIDENGKNFKLSSQIIKQLKSSYEHSKYNGFEVFLKGFVTFDEKNRSSLTLYDILLKNEYEQIIQSKRYSIRYENLLFRFLELKAKDVKLIFSYPFNKDNLKIVVNQFIKTFKYDSLVFRKNVPYKYEDDLVVEKVAEDFTAEITGYEEGTIIKREYNDKQEVVSEAPVSCISLFHVSDGDERIDIPLDNINDSEKARFFGIGDRLIGGKCVCRKYSILNCSGYCFLKLENELN